jgi:DNA-binding transcriptional MerR regulator
MRLKASGTIGVSEAARFLQLSEHRVIVYADAGRLPCRRNDSGHRRFDVEDLRAFKQERRQRTAVSAE